MLTHSVLLDRLACRYIWWESVDWAYAHPDVFVSNVMNLGNWNDIVSLRQAVSDAVLKNVLQDAPAGYFHIRSWDYWHAKFGMRIRPLPERKLS